MDDQSLFCILALTTLPLAVSMTLDCDKLSNRMSIVHGRELSIGPVLFETVERVMTYTFRMELVSFKRGDDLIDLIEPEINLECEFDNTITVTEGNLLPPTYCYGTYVTLKRIYTIELEVYQNDLRGQVTLRLRVDYYDSNKYRILMMTNGDNETLTDCPTDDAFELVVTRYNNPAALSSYVLASASGGVAIAVVVIGAAVLVFHRYRLSRQQQTEDTNLKRFCDDKDMGNGLEHAIIVYSQTSIQKPAHEKDPALRKYYKRVKDAHKYVTKKMQKSKSYVDPIFSSKHRLSSIQGVSRHWALIRLAVIGYRKSKIVSKRID